MALAETLNKPIDPFSSIGEISKGVDISTRAQTAREQLEPLAREEAAAEEAVKLREARLKLQQAQEATKIEEGFAQEKRQALEKYQKELPQQPMFNPTEFDSTSAGELAGLTAIIGTLAGGSSARAALRSMAGFTRGAKEGRADLYDREVKQFEKYLSAWKNNINMAKDQLTQIIDLLGTDKNAALVKMKELEPNLDEGLIKAQVRMGNPKRALEIASKAAQAGDQAEVAYVKSVNKGGGLKPGATERDRYSMQYELLSLGNQIKQRLQDPKLAAIVNQPKIRAGLFLQEESKLLDQFLQPQIPQEVRQLAILIKKYRNSVYRAESGLAVTAYEAMRQYGANPQPGSTSQVLLDQIDVLNDVAKRSIRKAETIYPDLAEVGVALQNYESMEKEGRSAAQRQGLAPVTSQTPAQTEGAAEQPNVDRRNLPTPQNQAEFDALAPGAMYIDPDDNQIYRKPRR